MKERPIHLELIEMTNYLWKNKKYILNAMIVSLITGIIIAFSIPQKYTVKVELATESNSQNGSTLSGMASMLGIGNLSSNANEALNTGIYPDIISSTPFLLEVLNIKVKTDDNKEITLKEYIKDQKMPWWKTIISLSGSVFSSSSKHTHQTDTSSLHQTTLLKLSPDDQYCLSLIKKSITAEMERKSNIFSITVSLQNPNITAQTADSVAVKLQEYVTYYRTHKAQENYDYLEKLYEQRKHEYYQLQQAYANSYDQNQNIISRRAAINQERLKNEMGLAYQIYTQISTQLDMAKAKIQEVVPVFTIIEPAIVPTTPSAPNKKIIILGCVMLGFVISSIYILIWNGLFSVLKNIIHSVTKN